jgi:predicted AAA+ superfamily ATPase
MAAYINPYDFERPVKDPNLFAGRQKELEEINYYLELSKSERPVYHNLAVIGPRAVGKTVCLI